MQYENVSVDFFLPYLDSTTTTTTHNLRSSKIHERRKKVKMTFLLLLLTADCCYIVYTSVQPTHSEHALLVSCAYGNFPAGPTIGRSIIYEKNGMAQIPEFLIGCVKVERFLHRIN